MTPLPIEQLTLDTITLQQLDFVPQCESVHHNETGTHTGNAEYLQVGYCEHATGLRCGSYSRHIMQNPDLNTYCDECSIQGPVGFIPLGDI